MSQRELVSHVIRRLGLGSPPGLVEAAGDVDEAIARSLDLSASPDPPPMTEVPADIRSARDIRYLWPTGLWWLNQMIDGPRRLEERMVWFWHDHFPSAVSKVPAYLMAVQHHTLRRHATGSFVDLLRAVARDPAMLIYLDGVHNTQGHPNENFSREVMELFTLGAGIYVQDDVVAGARAFSGWVIAVPDRIPVDAPVEPWQPVFIPRRHDGGQKTFLGVTGPLDMDGALDVLLDHPATAERISAKLHAELVGFPPDPSAAERIAQAFRRDYSISALIEAIVAGPHFLSDQAVLSRVRTPLERMIGIRQAFGRSPLEPHTAERAVAALTTIGYVPFAPPNVGGFPKGSRLLGPYQLVHGFDLIAAADRPEESGRAPARELFARLGRFDVSPAALQVVDAETDPAGRLALAVNSPEFMLT